MKKLLLLLPLALSACQPKQAPEPPAAPDAETSRTAETPPVPAGDPNEPATYVGLSLSVAQQTAEKAGLRHRIVRLDGEERMVTRDFIPTRLNFIVENDVVTEVTKG